jgi:hypothetical protein
MPNVQTDKTRQAYRKDDNDRRCERAAPHVPLDNQYRAIGISAVAAAMRYRPETSRNVYAPKLIREQD